MPPANYQGQQARSLPSTVFHAETTLTTDLGQYGTDLTASGGAAYEDPSARTALFSERSVTIECTMNTSSSGALIYHGSNAVSPTYDISVASSVVTIVDNGALSLSATVPGLVAGDRTVHVLAATKADPIGGTYYTELTVYNETNDDDPVTVRQTHAAIVPDVTDHLSIGGRWNGATIKSAYSETIVGVRIDKVYLPPHMLREWVTESSPAAYAAKTECARLVVPNGELDAEEVGQMAGPALMLGGHAHKGHGLRLLGPVLTRAYPDPQACDQNDFDNTYDNSWHTAYGANYRTAIPFLDYVWLPPGGSGNRFAVRVHAKVYNALGAASDLEIRCYSSNRKPGLGGFQNQNAPPLERYYVTEDVSDHGVAGDGEIVEFSNLLKIARTGDGGTWVFLTFNHGAGSPDANDRFEIGSWTMDLLSVDTGGGIGDIQGG